MVPTYMKTIYEQYSKGEVESDKGDEATLPF